MDIVLQIFIVFFSVVIIRKCSSSFDVAANFLTRNFSEGIKGPTINAIASSLPELMISSMFLFFYKDIVGFSAGFATIIGSSAFNIAVIPVVSYMCLYFIKGKSVIFNINKSIVIQDSFFLLGSIIILSLGFFIGVNLYLGILLILFYLLYIYFLLTKRAKTQKKNNISTKNIFSENGTFFYSLYNLKLFRLFFQGKVNTITSVFVVFLCVFLIGFSCFFLVEATEKISEFFNIHLFFGAFVIAAIASSVPDTILSIQDAKNEKFFDSFSNAYGSNVFDICIGIGLPVLMYSFASNYDSTIYKPIDMTMDIERIGLLNIGDYVLNANLFIWSLLILFLFTIIVSFIYYKNNIKLHVTYVIIFLYMLFIGALISY